jgi:hypothetical protein
MYKAGGKPRQFEVAEVFIEDNPEYKASCSQAEAK